MEEEIISGHGNYMENFRSSEDKEFFPGSLISFRQENAHRFYFETAFTILEVTVVSDFIFRFRYANNFIFEDDFSYAMAKDFSPEPPTVSWEEKAGHYEISTTTLTCIIYKQDLRKRILDKEGKVINEDEKGFHWEEDKETGNNIVIETKTLQNDEAFFGLGDKPCQLNLKGKRLQLWGSDTYGYGKDTDPIYKNIPFFLGLHQNVGYGIFLDNTFRSFFDFGHERKNAYSFWAHGGEMNYYFIYGPQLIKVCETFVHMTGRPELPPMWALGYQQSKWSYYPESKVRKLAQEFREHRVPCDVIHLDIDYMEGYRCFTWSKNNFPDPKRLISDLSGQGFKTVVIIDPGIKEDRNYWVYQQGIENDYFCRRTDGPLMRGSVWPGICVFPDFTHPKVRQWWSGLFEGLIDDGVRGIWNDMNEPAVFEEGTFPDDVRHDFDGHPCSHRKAHNVYGMQMVRATNNGIKRLLKSNRPFTITRSAYAGTQRYAAVWTGDNVANWEHLTIANIQCQRLSTSGISFAGSDVGGFVEKPEGELYTRWIQMAVFHPFFRTHTSGDHGDKEPWTFGPDYEGIIRKFIELRYQLLPYIYTTFWQYVRYGTPMLKSSFLVNQHDEEAYNRQEEFFMGDHLMICPISQPGADGRWLYLPKGTWYHYWDDTPYTDGGEVWIEADLNHIPLFVRAGAIIPHYPVQQFVGEKTIEVLTLNAYYSTESTKSVLYEDAGDGYEYLEGACNVKTFMVSGSSDRLTITQSKEGNFSPSYPTYEIILHGVTFGIKTCMVDGVEVAVEITKEEPTKVLVSADFREIVIGE